MTENFATVRVRPDTWVMTHVVLLNCIPGMEGIHLIPCAGINAHLLHHTVLPKGVRLSPLGTQWHGDALKKLRSPLI